MTIFIFAALAAFRVTRLITVDDIGGPIRAFWGSKFPVGSKRAMLIGCPYCVGAYVSLAFTLILTLAVDGFRHWWMIWLIWPALAGAQSLLNAIDDRLNQ